MRHKKFTPRAEYRAAEGQRIKESVSLAEKYQDLKALTVELAYYGPEGARRNRLIKYTVNPDFARSVFRFDCLNHECVRGDFDLSEALAQAVAGHRATAAGELRCRGWLSKTTIDEVRCANILRYRLDLEYGVRPPRPAVPAPTDGEPAPAPPGEAAR